MKFSYEYSTNRQDCHAFGKKLCTNSRSGHKKYSMAPCHAVFLWNFRCRDRNRGLLLFPGIEPHAHQQTALDIGQVPLLEITEDLRLRRRAGSRCTGRVCGTPGAADALGGVDAQVDDVQVTGDFVERLEFLAHAVDRIALFQQSLLDLVGVFSG